MMMMMIMMMIHDKLKERYNEGMVCHKTKNVTEKKHKMMIKDGNRRTTRNRQGEREFQHKKGEQRRTKRRISPYT